MKKIKLKLARRTLKGAVTGMQVFLIALTVSGLVGGGLWLLLGGKVPAQAIQREARLGDCAIEDVTVRGIASNVISGATASVNAEVHTGDGSREASDVNVNGVASLTTTFPPNQGGYVLLGNDNLQSSTDRGTEYWYTRYEIPNVGCNGVAKNTVEGKLFAEETGTSVLRFFEGGTEEATPNVTLGANDESRDEMIWITAGNDVAIGVPGVSKLPGFSALGLDPARDSGIGVCFNESTVGTFDTIEVTNSLKQFPIPQNLSGNSYLGTCYVIPQSAIEPYTASDGVTYQDAIIDNRHATVNLRFDTTGTNPGITASVGVSIITVCYSRDGDNAGQWTLGWWDTEKEAQDFPCGLETTVANYKGYVNLT